MLLKMSQQLISTQGISATVDHIEEQVERWVQEMGQSGRLPAALLNQLQQAGQLPRDLLPLVQGDFTGTVLSCLRFWPSFTGLFLVSR